MLVCAGAFYGGITRRASFGISNPQAQVSTWRDELAQQQAIVDTTRRTLQQNLDALALRIGQMNAHVVRLDALGTRLTQMAGLKDGEFDFTSVPSLGGPEEPLADDGGDADQRRRRRARRARRAARRSQPPAHGARGPAAESQAARRGSARGSARHAGYVSSQFGSRTDPFTGRRAFHKGVDFAGREGAEVVAVASGVVIWSGERYGYGQLVEINHGNGYVTRYAHNVDNLVAVGDTVRRGQVIARMGDTGRATGPNLHFEVLLNDKPVDPLTYVGQYDGINSP